MRWSRRRVLQGLLGAALGVGLARQGARFPTYAYASATFAQFVQDSYALAPTPKPQPFRGWLEARYASAYGLPLKRALAQHRASSAVQAATWLHQTVKALIPRFSLERGFEFYNAVLRGERQCLLQSVLIASLLQELGLEAGVVMVWRNQAGKESNLGHAVTLLRLPEGGHLLVDASDPTPFIPHQGLYLWDASARDYRFVEPRFTPDGRIKNYLRLADGKPLGLEIALPLDTAFLHAQFDYYRGERAPGGFLGPSTPEGLAASAHFLQRATQRQPRNPLVVYVLGHVYRKEGRLEEARAQFRQGYLLYKAQGHVPPGPQQAWAES